MARNTAASRGIEIEIDDSGGEGLRPSKAALKRHSHALQALGVAVAALDEERLSGVEMPEPLREAIQQLRRTKSREGRRRQMQYVGKLMRGADERSLREAVAAASLGSAKEALALHEAERWRAELIAGDEALERWLRAHPDSDGQQLRSLIRAARRDSGPPQERQPKSYRDLFRFIREEASHE